MPPSSDLSPPKWLIWVFAVCIVLAVAYGFWWRFAAGLLVKNLEDFRTRGATGVTAAWSNLHVSGFPLRLRATMDNPAFENVGGQLTWHAGQLSVEMLPWTISQFVLSAQGPQKLVIGDGVRSMTVNGQAETTQLSLMFRGEGIPAQLDVAATKANATTMTDGAEPIRIAGDVIGLHWRISPDDPEPKDGQDFDAAANGTLLKIEGVDLPFGPDIADIDLQITLKNVPALQGVAGAMDLPGWIAQHAPLAVRKLTLVSGGVDISGSGELSLAADGTVNGELNLLIGGLNKIVDVLSAKGLLQGEAKTALSLTTTMIAITGAKVPMPLSFKDGQTYLGPARVGPAPRIVF